MLTITNRYKRVIALIADLHIGSRYAVWPKKYISPADGSNISAMMNQGQKEILNYFNDFIKTVNRLKADSVFIVGDVTAGWNPKEFGMYLMTTDLEEQIEAALKLLKPLCKKRKVAVWRGTPYHESTATNIRVHKRIAEELNGHYFDTIANLRLLPSKRIANITHRSTAAVMYPETIMGRDMMLFKEAEALGYLPGKIDIIIRAHRHKWCYIHKRAQHYIQLPCWQAFVPYFKISRWYARVQPDIGGAILMIDDKDRIRVWHFLYPLVHIADKEVKI